MKELPIPFEPVFTVPLIEATYTTKRKRKETPRWIVAQSRTNHKCQQWQNDAVESHYHRVIETVKQFIIHHDSDTVYEQDHKENKGSYTGMHSFVTSTFYWRLDCELVYNYKIYFAFHNCPYEEMVRQMMQGYPLDRTTQEHHFPQGYDSFYKRVLEVQDPLHIHTLKANRP